MPRVIPGKWDMTCDVTLWQKASDVFLGKKRIKHKVIIHSPTLNLWNSRNPALDIVISKIELGAPFRTRSKGPKSWMAHQDPISIRPKSQNQKSLEATSQKPFLVTTILTPDSVTYANHYEFEIVNWESRKSVVDYYYKALTNERAHFRNRYTYITLKVIPLALTNLIVGVLIGTPYSLPMEFNPFNNYHCEQWPQRSQSRVGGSLYQNPVNHLQIMFTGFQWMGRMLLKSTTILRYLELMISFSTQATQEMKDLEEKVTLF